MIRFVCYIIGDAGATGFLQAIGEVGCLPLARSQFAAN